jgi:AcrR family transcriptional regulator
MKEMQGVDEPRRAYHSPRRQQQARLTRRAILDAALPLFVQRGYPGTSLADIAQAAGVALKTVQAVFGTKARLLSALWDVTVAGDDEAIPVAERAWFREMLEEPDARRQLELGARVARQMKHRVGALTEVIRRAAQTDPEIGALWQVFQDQYLENQTMMAASLAVKGALREGLDVADAAEMLWTLNHPSIYYLLVYERGWSEERYERWLADAFVHQLLR